MYSMSEGCSPPLRTEKCRLTTSECRKLELGGKCSHFPFAQQVHQEHLPGSGRDLKRKINNHKGKGRTIKTCLPLRVQRSHIWSGRMGLYVSPPLKDGHHCHSKMGSSRPIPNSYTPNPNVFVVLGMEPRIWHMLGKSSTT